MNKNIEDLLYNECKNSGNVDEYDKIRIYVSYDDFEKKLKNSTILEYITKITNLVNPQSGFMRDDKGIYMDNIDKLLGVIGVKDEDLCLVKKFIKSNELVRLGQFGWTNRIVLNPFKIKYTNYISDITAMVFQDFIKEDVNMARCSVEWLRAIGYVK